MGYEMGGRVAYTRERDKNFIKKFLLITNNSVALVHERTIPTKRPLPTLQDKELRLENRNGTNQQK
jgi:hypothetical protein